MLNDFVPPEWLDPDSELLFVPKCPKDQDPRDWLLAIQADKRLSKREESAALGVSTIVKQRLSKNDIKGAMEIVGWAEQHLLPGLDAAPAILLQGTLGNLRFKLAEHTYLDAECLILLKQGADDLMVATKLYKKMIRAQTPGRMYVDAQLWRATAHSRIHRHMARRQMQRQETVNHLNQALKKTQDYWDDSERQQRSGSLSYARVFIERGRCHLDYVRHRIGSQIEHVKSAHECFQFATRCITKLLYGQNHVSVKAGTYDWLRPAELKNSKYDSMNLKRQRAFAQLLPILIENLGQTHIWLGNVMRGIKTYECARKYYDAPIYKLRDDERAQFETDAKRAKFRLDNCIAFAWQKRNSVVAKDKMAQITARARQAIAQQSSGEIKPAEMSRIIRPTVFLLYRLSKLAKYQGAISESKAYWRIGLALIDQDSTGKSNGLIYKFNRIWDAKKPDSADEKDLTQTEIAEGPNGGGIPGVYEADADDVVNFMDLNHNSFLEDFDEPLEGNERSKWDQNDDTKTSKTLFVASHDLPHSDDLQTFLKRLQIDVDHGYPPGIILNLRRVANALEHSSFYEKSIPCRVPAFAVLLKTVEGIAFGTLLEDEFLEEDQESILPKLHNTLLYCPAFPASDNDLREHLLLLAVQLARQYEQDIAPGVLFQLANCQRQTHKIPEALENYEAALLAARRMGHWRIAVKIAHRLLGIYTAAGMKAEAFSAAKTLFHQARSAPRRVLPGTDRMQMLSNPQLHAAVSECALALAESHENAQEVFEAIELTKGRRLGELRTGLPRQHLIEDWVDYPKLQQMLCRLEVIEHKLEWSDTIEETAKLEALQRELFEDLFRELDEVQRENGFIPYVPYFSCYRLKDMLEGWTRNRHTPKRIALIHYLTHETGAQAAVLRIGFGDDAQPFITRALPAEVGEIQRLANDCWKDIEESFEMEGGLSDDSLDILRDCYQLLFQPLAADVEGADLIYIIPDEALADLPFHAFIGNDNQYLISRYEIGYLPTAEFLRFMPSKNESPEQARALLVGHDASINAPEAVSRLRAHMHKLAWRGPVIVPNTEEEAMDRLLNPGWNWTIIHVMGHGCSGAGLKSFVRLNRKNLHGSAIVERGACGQFAFFNSCYLGKGTTQAGNIFGMPYALLTRSESCLVANRKIYENVAVPFARRTYTHLLGGEDRSTAVALSIRVCLKAENGRGAHPFDWAPYFFYGNFQPLRFSSGKSKALKDNSASDSLLEPKGVGLQAALSHRNNIKKNLKRRRLRK